MAPGWAVTHARNPSLGGDHRVSEKVNPRRAERLRELPGRVGSGVKDSRTQMSRVPTTGPGAGTCPNQEGPEAPRLRTSRALALEGGQG